MSIDIQYASEALGEYLTVEIEEPLLSYYVEIKIREAEIARLQEEIEQADARSERKAELNTSLKEVRKVLRELKAWRKARRSK